MSRLERTIGARSVLFLLLVTVLLRTGFTLGLWAFGGVEAARQPEVYYALTMLQGAIIFGIPVFLFIYLFRPRYMPVLKAQMAYPSFSMAVRTVLAALAGAFTLEMYTNLWAIFLDWAGIPLWISEVPLPNNVPQIILAVAGMAIFPAVLEELLFRGVLLEGLKREMSRKRAVWLAALLFALMHGSLVGLPVHLILGLLITLMALRRNNLQIPMLYHFTHNGTSLLVSLYFRNILEGMEGSAQAAQAQGAVSAPAIFSLVIMILLFTFVFVWLIRPLIAPGPPAQEEGFYLPLAGKKRRTVYVLAAVLFILLLPWYVVNFFPA